MHTILTRVWKGESSLPHSVHHWPQAEVLSQPTATHQANRDKQQRKTQSHKGCAIASCDPHLLKDKNHMGTLSWQYSQHTLRAAGTVLPLAGRARVHTQRTAAGLASLSGYQQTPRAGNQGNLLRPPSQHKGAILYLTGEEPRLDDIA